MPDRRSRTVPLWPWALLALATPTFLMWLAATGQWPLDGDGNFRLFDFAMMWTAGLRVLSGEAASVYDHLLHTGFQSRILAQGGEEGLPFGYPPQALLFVGILPSLPYVAAFAAFLAATFAGWCATLFRIVGDWKTATAMALAIGGATQTVILGQTGFLTAALLVGGLVAMDHRPRLAGVAFALLAFKPHLGIALALALLMWRRWTTILSACMTLAVLLALTTLVFGPNIWTAYLEGSRELAAYVVDREKTVVAQMMQSVWAMALPRSGAGAAMQVQIASAAMALGVVALVTRLTDDGRVRSAAVIAATLLCTPYLFLYDTTMLVGAIALLLARAPSRTALVFCYAAAALNAAWLFVQASFGPVPAMLVLAAAVLVALDDRDASAGETPATS